MVFDSNQINQMIGGQQAMFANHAAFAHNIGSQALGGPVQGLSSPSFGRAQNTSPGGMGAGAVGMMGQAIPGAAMGVSMAGGLGMMGSAGAYADPFTGVGRSFMGGARAAGGMGGGVGALGAGLRAAALPALGYYAAYKGISHVGEQIYRGAQNIGQVGGMAQQYMGPQYGEAGARPGGQMARGAVKNIVSALHEIAGEETMASMQDLTRIMDRAGRFGMLTGISSAEQFKQKFRGIVKQAKSIAQIMGTTIEEAMPTLQGFQQMGLWSAQDVMGAGMALKGAGGAAPQMMGAMQAGAQRSWAMGGSMAGGAAMGRNMFANVRAAMTSGALPRETLMEYTGGVGGARGQEMMAKRLTGAMQSMTQTPIGRLSMMGLGETREGAFTGRIDPEKLARFKRGEISVEQLQSMGQRATGTRAGAASFVRRQEQIGQELMSQGGMGLMGGMLESGLRGAGLEDAGEDVRGLFLQKITGMGRRDAMMWQKLLRSLPEIQEQKGRKELAIIQDAMRAVDERQNRSWAGFSDVISHAFEETAERPIQEFAEKLSTSWNERWDRVSDDFLGRVRQVNMSRQEQVRRLLSDVSQGTPAGRARMTQSMELFERSSLQGRFDTPTVQRMKQEGVVGGLVGAGLSALGIETGQGTRAELLLSAGARPSLGTGGAGDLQFTNVGFEAYIPASEIRNITPRIRMRGGTANMDRMFKKDSSTRRAMEKVKSAYLALTGNVHNLALFDEAKKEMSPADYQKFVRKRLESMPGIKEEMMTLQENSTQPDATIESTALDAISVVQGEAGYLKTGLEIDFAKHATESGASLEGILTDGEEFSKEVNRRTADILKQVKGTAIGGAPVGAGLALMGPAAGVAGLGLQVAGAFGYEISEREGGLSEEQLRNIMESGPAGEELEAFLAGGGSDFRQFTHLTQEMQGNPGLRQFIISVGQMSSEERKNLATQVRQEGVSGLYNARTMMQRMGERAAGAGQELGQLGEGGPRGLREVLTMLKGAGRGGVAERRRQYQKAQGAARGYAAEIAGGEEAEERIRELRETGGAVADHVADLAEIRRLNIQEMVGEGARGAITPGLRDELAMAKRHVGVIAQQMPGVSEKQLDAALKSKDLTKEQAELLKKTLKRVEERIGLEASKAAREDVQVKLNNSLTSFVGANENFVLAVSAAVPLLGDVTAGAVAAAAREIAQNQATGGTSGGKGFFAKLFGGN